MALQELLKSRTSTKGSLTRLESWFLQHKGSCTEMLELENRLIRLHALFSTYDEVQNKIEGFATEQEPDTEDRALVENKYFSLVSEFSNCIKKLSQGDDQNLPRAQSVAPGSGLSENVQPNTFAVKLPDINIQVFSGDIKEFESFYQLFDALIVKNIQLTDIQKFIYLKSYLKGEPLQLIDSLQITNENFHIALRTLKCRFENKFAIINSYLSAMLEIPNMTKCKPSSLREFVTTIQKNIQSLKNLQFSHEELWNIVLIFLFQKKLDFGTKRAFEMERDHSEIPNLDYFLKFLEKRCVVLENIEISSPKSQRKLVSAYHSAVKKNQYSSQYSNCIYCNKTGHRIYTCFQFKNLQLQEKTKFVRSNKLCNNCLGKHNIEECSSTQKCSICGKNHNTLLHISKGSEHQHSQPKGSNDPSKSHFQNQPIYRSRVFGQPPINIQNDNVPQTSGSLIQSEDNQASMPTNYNSMSHSALSIKNCHVLLATAMVTLYSNKGKPILAKALLDNGSQNSFITQSLLDKLECNPYKINLSVTGISGRSTISKQMVDVKIHSNIDLRKSFKISCAVLPHITCKLPQCRIMIEKLDIPANLVLADEDFFKSSDIDILLGLDVYYDIILQGLVRLGKNLPVLQETHLGWVVAGTVAGNLTVSNLCLSEDVEYLSNNISLVSNCRLDSLIKNFWDMEEISETPILSKDDELAEGIFSYTTKILENGRFQVNLPLKSSSEHLKLGESFTVAKRRFFSLENRFQKDPNLFREYKNFINEYVSLGHAQYVPLTLQNPKLQNKYFIPHLCVVRDTSATTKLRVVFDASCKSSSGHSLNDICLKGYQVQPDLYDILCRFRLFPFVVTTDIQKMYRQVVVNPEQRFLQNILWRENQQDDLKCIQLDTVTYGTNSAPFLATRVLKEIALVNSNSFPLAAEAILTQFYMDDGLCGADDLNTLLELHNQLNSLLYKYGFELHKYCSNSETFLKSVCEKPTKDYDINFGNISNKVLGLMWNPIADFLCITVPQNLPTTPVTKRKILSILAQCYDPLGLINPVIVKGKILMQQLWIQKLDWDSVITDHFILREWGTFIENLPLLSKQNIPRFYFSGENIQALELHGFADASLAAYGCCVYFRAIYQDGTNSCTLISSKSRVAPVKTITLPRLELCAMLILSKLVKKLLTVFEIKLKFQSVNLWTDSQIALCWCKGLANRWSVFVSHRVSQIQELTSNYKWRHVKSAENAADMLSRGMFAQDILNNDMWWKGPKFLQDSKLSLSNEDQSIAISEIPEERKSCLVTETIQSNTYWENVMLKFSSFSRMQRTLGFMFRFINNIRKNKTSGPLSIDELDFSVRFVIKQIQGKYFFKEISELSSNRQISNRQLLPLKPFLDDSGLLRVGGRLENATVSFQQKHPLLLPSHNHVTSLILKYEHKRLGHAGAQTVLGNVRLRFWPLNGLRETKNIIRNCVPCFRFNSKTSQQIMASLPQDRVTISRPFQKSGVDFGGPFLIKSSRLRKSPLIKAYISIFICMVTKAVHIEVVTSLSTDAFINTLKRFISRRGNPSIIYSDNATNFSGSKNQLKELYNFFRNKNNSREISEFLSQNETTWKFIPPKSPHWGGIWEAAIKSAKYHMRRLIGSSSFTYEEFTTILCQIEAIMNSRPLSALSNDPADLNYLTPGHFLIGSNLTAYPEKDVTAVPENRLSVFKQISQIRQIFWKRWSVDYLNRLQTRPKWFQDRENLKVNDLVLLKEDDMPPLNWPLARVIEVYPGKDGKVRVARIKTANGIYTRPITKLHLLPNQS